MRKGGRGWAGKASVCVYIYKLWRDSPYVRSVIGSLESVTEESENCFLDAGHKLQLEVRGFKGSLREFLRFAIFL